jgi:hypothetical protein
MGNKLIISSSKADIEKWSCEALCAELRRQGYPTFAECFGINDIDGLMVLSLDDAALSDLGLSPVERIRAKAGIQRAISSTGLNSNSAALTTASSASPGASIFSQADSAVTQQRFMISAETLPTPGVVGSSVPALSIGATQRPLWPASTPSSSSSPGAYATSQQADAADTQQSFIFSADALPPPGGAGAGRPAVGGHRVCPTCLRY